MTGNADSPIRPAQLAHLAIGELETVVRWADASGASTKTQLPIGTQALGAGPFRHTPPTPLEMEHAIEAVENVVMPLAKVLAAGTALHTADAHGHTLAALAHPGQPAPSILSTDNVEHIFNQLVAVSEGRPAASSGLPPDPAFTAWMLILREFMHHLRFASITVEAPSQPAGDRA